MEAADITLISGDAHGVARAIALSKATVRELLAGAGLEEGGVARRLFGDLAYRSEALGEGQTRTACIGLILNPSSAHKAPSLWC
jgi:hypothetical protein